MPPRRPVPLALAAATSLTLLVALAPAAGAQDPDVRAESTCVDGIPAIAVTPKAFGGGSAAEQVNRDIRVDVRGGRDGDRSQDGLYLSPDYEERVVFEVPDAVGRTLTVRVTAVAPWGPAGEYGQAGTWRETTVPVTPCPAPGTTTPATDTDDSAADVDPGSAIEAVTDPQQVQVLGASVIRVRADRAVAATTEDATSTRAFGIGAGAAVAAAVAAVAAGRHRRGRATAGD